MFLASCYKLMSKHQITNGIANLWLSLFIKMSEPVRLTDREHRRQARERTQLNKLVKIVALILKNNDLDADPAIGKWPERIGQIFGSNVLTSLRNTKPDLEGYRQIIKFLDQGAEERPQPDPEVITEFMRMCTWLHKPGAEYSLSSNGSIRRIGDSKNARILYAPLLLRPRLTFPQKVILLDDFRMAIYLRDRMKTIMLEVERRENLKKFLHCDEVF